MDKEEEEIYNSRATAFLLRNGFANGPIVRALAPLLVAFYKEQKE